MCCVRTLGLVLLSVVAFVWPSKPALCQPQSGGFKDEPLPEGALLRIGTTAWRAGMVYSSVLSPDGQLAFVGTRDGIDIFELDSGRRVRTIKAPEETIRALAISRDGKLLASAGYEGSVLWDVDAGQQLRTLKTGSVAVVTFSPDGKKLITGGEDHERSVRVFDVASGKEELRMLWHRRRVTLVACAPDNKTLVSAAWDGDVNVVDVTTGERVHTVQNKNSSDPIVALSPDGKTVALADSRYEGRSRRWIPGLRLIDVATGKQRPITDDSGDKPAERTTGLLFSPDNKSLVVSGEKEFRVWDIESGKPTRAFPGGSHRAQFTPDGRRLVHAGPIIRVWDFQSGKELHPPEGPLGASDSLTFSPDGQTLAGCSFSDRGVIQLWDARRGELKGSLRGHDGYIRAVQFAPDGSLVSGGGDSTLRVWDVPGGKEASQFKLHEPRAGEKPLQVIAMEISGDGRTLTAGAVGFEGHFKEKTHVFAWNLANGKLLASHQHEGGFSDWPGFGVDGKTFLLRGEKGGLVLNDLLTGKELLKLEPAPQPSGDGVLNPNVLESPYTFSPDGRVVAVRGSRQRNEGPRYWRDNYAIIFFDLKTGKEMHRVSVDTWLARAAFSPDSSRLAGADGRRVRIWDTVSGKELWRSPELECRITALAFSPDGNRLATALDNITTLIWDARPNK